MTPVKVTGEAVLSTLREVVAERPDYVYEAPEHQREVLLSCYYVHTSDEAETPGCLVGHVLNRLGVPLDVLQRYEGSDADLVVERTLDLSGPEATEAVWALRIAQVEQDSGNPWSLALERALRKPGE